MTSLMSRVNIGVTGFAGGSMKISLKDIKIKFFKSSGPGGQHKNKKFTAVKVFHSLTGISAVATEQRSQAQNKAIALARLRSKVERLTRKKKKRISIRMSSAAKERILESKKRRSQKKRLRRKIGEEE